MRRASQPESSLVSESPTWDVDASSLTSWLQSHGAPPPIEDFGGDASPGPAFTSATSSLDAETEASSVLDDEVASEALPRLPDGSGVASSPWDDATAISASSSPTRDEELTPRVDRDDGAASGEVDGEEFWDAALTKAMADARSLNSAEAWRAVVEAANVVSDVSSIMARLADEVRLAAEKERATTEARLRLERLVVLVDEAERTASERVRLAEEAEAAARKARQEATEAKEHAVRVAKDMPEAEEAAERAARDSAVARERAEEIGVAVRLARDSNAAEGWSEARAVAFKDATSEDADVD